MDIRQRSWQAIKDQLFDIVIIGGGINGASAYRRLCREGFKVLLIDKGDFAGGTSQASAMMVWGGLLYLKNLDLFSVYGFSKDRDDLIGAFQSQVASQYFRYLPNRTWGRNKYLVYLALQLYWLLGRCHRTRPVFQKHFPEQSILRTDHISSALLYQEGFLNLSDCRFVLEWILTHQSEESLAMNYCTMEDATYSFKEKFWTATLKENFSARECTIRSRLFINCAGAWTDTVNQAFGIRSPYKHVFSKGVFIGFPRPEEHTLPLFFDMGEHGDTLAFIPWGPISLWGPTETMEESLDCGFSASAEDIEFLLAHASRHLKPSVAGSKIISLRCGLRPLAVKRDFQSSCYPLDLSRHHKVVEDPDMPWLSVYGGKISGCLSLAEAILQKVSSKISPSLPKFQPDSRLIADSSATTYPGLAEQVPAIAECVEKEFCCTLDDYLRRRTNIAQWIPREGLGFQNENLSYLRNLAESLPKKEGETQEGIAQDYLRKVEIAHDGIIK